MSASQRRKGHACEIHVTQARVCRVCTTIAEAERLRRQALLTGPRKLRGRPPKPDYERAGWRAKVTK